MQSNIDLLHTNFVGIGEINMPQSEKTAAASLAGKIKGYCTDCSQFLPQSTSNASCKMALRAYRASLRPTEAKATKVVFFTLKPRNDFSKVENISNLISTGNKITSVDVAHHVCVFVCLCGRTRSTAIYLHCFRSSEVFPLIPGQVYYCTDWM